MEQKINIAKLLKDCPKGMELDCTLFSNVTFNYVANDGIWIKYFDSKGYENEIYLDCEGCLPLPSLNSVTDKCVIFPKGKTTWEGFAPPCKFKEGDIVCNIENSIIIYKEISPKGYCGSFASLYHNNIFIPHYLAYPEDTCRLATEEEKQKLFEAIKANGYHWNPKTKTLKELVKPKFKVGDRIKQIGSPRSYIIKTIEFDRYVLNNNQFVRFRDEHIYELVPNKFDITTLKPFESRVLMRDENTEKWVAQFFSHYNNGSDRPYTCIGCEGLNEYIQCIPYEGNEHLLDTTNDCDEYYKTW